MKLNEKQGSVNDRKSKARNKKKTKITEDQLINIHKDVVKNRFISANMLKYKHKINASTRTVQKYLNRLGWRKRRTSFCQIVSAKNRYERLMYAKFCIKNFD